MITTAIIVMLIGIAKLLLKLLPALDIRLPTGLVSGASEVFKGVGYFLPLKIISPIVAIILAYYTYNMAKFVIVTVRNWTPKI